MPVLLDKILRMGEGKVLRRLESVARQVNAIEDEFAAMSDAELRGQTDEFRRRLDDGETMDDLMPEAFATVRETARRVLGQRPFDVQVMGGAALHLGNIAEMKTGEGKTLVATMPVYLNALGGRGVHVVTVNDYLAKFHAEWMGRIYHFLGMSVGTILPAMSSAQRREAYGCDITYGTNNELGFDYLRDNMATSIDQCVQRGHAYAIVDEVDSILIDEARTPLIISGPTQDEVKWYAEFATISGRLRRDEDYEVDEKKRTVSVLEPAIDKVEDHLGIDNLYDSVNTPLISFLNNSIKAKELFRRDKEYVVLDGEVLIVDEHTGRILEGRRYNEGLHQAIEAKEKVRIREEYQTLATITLQNYFRLYEKLAGMTGTAMTEASEFDKIYNLGVVPIPTNEPVARTDEPDLVFRTEDAKFNAVVDDIAERNGRGQPILVGTTSVEKSERLATLLTKRGVPHEVLNAKQHEREAAIVAQAGHKGAVTVATNMAGRGTDIMLGGSVDFLADRALRERGLDPSETPEAYEAAWPETLEQIKAQVQGEHDEVTQVGGLAVIGTERHESRRIDNQLRGRSGRQGDPGDSRFYLSLEDDLMRLFKSDWVDWVLQTLKVPDDVPIENKRVTGAIASAQSQVESLNFESRKNILKYDDVMNRQRQVVYGERRRVLEGEDLHELARTMIGEVVEAYVVGATDGFPEEWDLDRLWAAMKTLYPMSFTLAEFEEEYGGRDALTAELLLESIRRDAQAAYDRREEQLGAEVTRELERRVMLSVLDRKWREHLYEMDYLREGIGLRAYSQRDPLVEYQREGYDLFATMMDGIKEESVGYLFNLEVQIEDEEAPDEETVLAEDRAPADADRRPLLDSAAPAAAAAATGQHPRLVAKGLGAAQAPQRLTYTAPTVDGDTGAPAAAAASRPGAAAGDGAAAGVGPLPAAGGAVRTEVADDPYADVPRNAPCPCGSGRKFKRCHGDPAMRTGASS